MIGQTALGGMKVIFLVLAFFSSALVSVLMRCSDSKVKSSLGMLAVNYIVCTLLAAVESGADLIPPEEGLGQAIAMGILNGFFYLGGFLLLRYNISRSGVVLSSTFMKLGLLVTMLISVVFFREQPGLPQTVGFILALAAIVLINGVPGKGSGTFRPALLLLVLTGGMCDGMSKIFEELGDPALSEHFLFFTFLTAMVLCLALAPWKKQFPGKWEWLFGILIGIPNFYSCRFLLLSLATVPGVVAYPVYAVAGILLVTLAGVVLFRERLTRRQWAALTVILGALILLNI